MTKDYMQELEANRLLAANGYATDGRPLHGAARRARRREVSFASLDPEVLDRLVPIETGGGIFRFPEDRPSVAVDASDAPDNDQTLIEIALES